MGKSEILRSKYAWKEAGIPQPKQGSNIGGLYNLRDLPVPKVMVRIPPMDSWKDF